MESFSSKERIYEVMTDKGNLSTFIADSWKAY